MSHGAHLALVSADHGRASSLSQQAPRAPVSERIYRTAPSGAQRVPPIRLRTPSIAKDRQRATVPSTSPRRWAPDKSRADETERPMRSVPGRGGNAGATT